MDEINIKKQGHITIISINRYNRRNAVDYKTSKMLENAFIEFNRDAEQHIAIITGENGTFSAGADLNDAKAMSAEVLGKMDLWVSQEWKL
jgi:Enoyl-CoA hydratase/carnithine racemase